MTFSHVIVATGILLLGTLTIRSAEIGARPPAQIAHAASAARLSLFDPAEFSPGGSFADPVPANPAVKTVSVTNPTYVVGYSIRTSGAKEMADPSELQGLWIRCIQKGFFASAPHRLGHHIVGAYSDYAPDGTFTYTLGALVSSTSDLPPGTSFHPITRGTYGVFSSDRGPLSRVLKSVWENASDAIEKDPRVTRAFATDYELFDEDTFAGNGTQVEVYIGLRSVHK